MFGEGGVAISCSLVGSLQGNASEISHDPAHLFSKSQKTDGA